MKRHIKTKSLKDAEMKEESENLSCQIYRKPSPWERGGGGEGRGEPFKNQGCSEGFGIFEI